MLLDDILNNMKKEENGSETRINPKSAVGTAPQMDMFESFMIEKVNKTYLSSPDYPKEILEKLFVC